MSEQTPDVEALARYLYDCEGFHAVDSWATESLITRGRYEALAEYILASDWLAARDQAAERRGAAKELREAADDIAENVDWSDGRNHYGDNEGYEHSARVLRARAGRIEAES